MADIGCGTGAEAFECLKRGAERVVCTEVSGLMLDRCRQSARDRGYGDDRIAFHLVDDSAGPLESGAFDVSLSSMVLGLIPDQLDFVREVARLARPGGTVALSAHGPSYDWQAIDAAFRGIPKRYVLGYRAEFWPLSEQYLRSLLERAGLTDIHTARRRWELPFDDPGLAFDFFSSSSSAFWSAQIPPDSRGAVAAMMRDKFGRRAVLQVTHDIVFAYGRVPAS
ncbi:MAG: class I SAM-dependent methyltransferase [Thermoleophilia bacterium]|nr:class I SAM-dependent methyltransferase [Thermoleophilia bacterium]